ncbi:enoyl-CoA hydratase-related protein [Amycolatopsis acidiphila]|uniref:Enoyl-CoA hydratase/isomerase family protein n=1 Tax=Amycolatopsis acidiphila TaxID=715473 RepID=A0A557ZZJ0_9PSEU|nr:enoyl-CoA hydratase-related protein [Amycolatopsis acidiphila]TVT17433.1 enoyl-CoA hydratase/isomerase family protein [Amycolatopsis acidiphila]UIJ57279.1 enoyl-CoA hydratase-related protein [Amycolatopsis acidiphila]GHG52310.1 enoyl-CoA hydratase [Amycolatopsis acidiphila]
MADEVGVSRPRPEVVRIELRRPERLNAMTADMVGQLHQALAEAGDDPSCRVVVLTGAGRGFCAGLDLAGYGDAPASAGSPGTGPVHQGLTTQRHIAALVQRIRRLPQPVIAAVNGPAAGGGLALVLAADLRLASTSAVFAVSFLKVGFSGCDIGTSWLLPRLVGAGRAHELMLTARRFDADEALRIGLLADAVAPQELERRVTTAIDDLLAAPPLSLALTKQGMWLALEMPSFDAAVELENRQQVLTLLTDDQTEAMRAYREGATPRYEGR